MESNPVEGEALIADDACSRGEASNSTDNSSCAGRAKDVRRKQRWSSVTSSIAERLFRLNQNSLRVAAFASLASLYVGYCVAISGSAFMYHERTSASRVWPKESFLSVLQFSAALGALACGFTADITGRRASLAVASLLGVLGALAAATSPLLVPLVLSQTFSGLAMGFCLVACPLYVAECAPKDHRGMLHSVSEQALSLGMALAFMSSYLCGSNWQRMLGLGAIPSAALGVAVLVLLPESPRWLAQVGNVRAAVQSLCHTQGSEEAAAVALDEILANSGYTSEETSLFSLQQDTPVSAPSLGPGVRRPYAPGQWQPSISGDPSKEWSSSISSMSSSVSSSILHSVSRLRQRLSKALVLWRGLFLHPSHATLQVLVMCTGVSFYQQATGVDASISYLPEILALAGLSTTAAECAASLGLAFCRAAAALLSGALVDEFGRTPMLFISSAGAAIALLAEAVVLQVLTLGQNLSDETAETLGAYTVQNRRVNAAIVVIIATCNFAAFFSLGLGPVAPTVQAESCTQPIRAPALGIAMAAGRLTTLLLVSSLIPLADSTSSGAPFFIFALVTLVSAPFLATGVKEMKGKSLEEAPRDQLGIVLSANGQNDDQLQMSAGQVIRRPVTRMDNYDVAPL